MRVSNTPPAGLVEHVTNLTLDEHLTERLKECTDDAEAVKMVAELVNRAIVNYQAVHDGESLNTVRMCPNTGKVAQRVAIEGVHKWQVMNPDGSIGYDTRPELTDWDLIRQGE